MNRCEEVLKKNTNKGLKIGKDELYHSDTYLGSEYDEGLKHWKYIRKYRSGGHWRYVYADKNTHNSINNAVSSAKKLVKDSYLGKNNKGEDMYKRNELYQALRRRDFADETINKHSIETKAKNAIKAVKDIHKEAVATGSRFIEKLLSKFK